MRERDPRGEEVTVLSNYTMNLTAGGAFLLPHGDRDGGARVVEVGPPAAGYGER